MYAMYAKPKALVFFFLFLLAMVVFPSFAAVVGTVISCFFQAIAVVLIANIFIRIVLMVFHAFFNKDSDEEEGVHKFA